jgi:predicted nucleic acid-binding protein
MIVVSDTSPINYLLLVGLIDLLPQLYGRVIIPEAVYSELSDPAAPEPIRVWIKQLPRWVEIHAVDRPDPTLSLGRGETEAITLALLLNADALLMDERKGRRVAMARGLTVSGTLNIIDAAASRGLIELAPAIDRLRQSGFRASADLVQGMLMRDAERKAQQKSEE